MSDQPFEPGPWDISRPEYHAEAAHVNHSSLEVFRISPRLYHGQFVTGEIPRPEPSAAMRLGTALHMAVLEPDRWAEAHAVAPEGLDRRTKAGKEAWADFEREADGKLVLTVEESKRLAGMLAAMRDCSLVRDWLRLGDRSEQPIRWIDPATGLPCKALLDRVCGGVVLDLKTASEPWPSAWAKAAANYGYARQAPFYLDGAAHALGLTDGMFVHVVVGTQPPYEWFPFELDGLALETGRRQNARTLERLRLCRETDSWASPWAHQVTTVSLPRLAWEEE